MPIFNPGDVVRVPFPYVEMPVYEMRPALVVSHTTLGVNRDLFWAVMITSAANRGWPGDVSVEHDYKAIGLPAPSIIRTEKIAVIEGGVASLLGQVSADTFDQVAAKLADYLGITRTAL
jgi:mRNA interferase MazF